MMAAVPLQCSVTRVNAVCRAHVHFVTDHALPQSDTYRQQCHANCDNQYLQQVCAQLSGQQWVAERTQNSACAAVHLAMVATLLLVRNTCREPCVIKNGAKCQLSATS